MTPNPKVKPVRSKHYLDFIRAKPCVVCGKPGPSHAAHQSVGYGVTGGKVSDLFTAPMCPKCHAEQHQGAGWSHPSALIRCVDFPIRCLEYINEFFSNGGRL